MKEFQFMEDQSCLKEKLIYKMQNKLNIIFLNFRLYIYSSINSYFSFILLIHLI